MVFEPKCNYIIFLINQQNVIIRGWSNVDTLVSPFIQMLKIIKYPISIFRFFKQQGSEQVYRVLTFIHFNKKRENGAWIELGNTRSKTVEETTSQQSSHWWRKSKSSITVRFHGKRFKMKIVWKTSWKRYLVKLWPSKVTKRPQSVSSYNSLTETLFIDVFKRVDLSKPS